MNIKEENIYIAIYTIGAILCILFEKNIEGLLMLILIALIEIKCEMKKINRNKNKI